MQLPQQLLPMVTQRDIALALQINQSTVSQALRGHRRISSDVRKRVTAMAVKLGYRENPYVKALMAQIRSSNSGTRQGGMALVIDRMSREEWISISSLALYRDGAVRRAEELGYELETFFLREENMSPEKIDRILYSRGILGIILGPPYQGNKTLPMRWDRYACVATGWGESKQDFDRIGNDFSGNFISAFERMCALGYARIGVFISKGNYSERRLRWIVGYLECQHYLPKKRRIPCFVRHGSEEQDKAGFQKWLRDWAPDAILVIDFHEYVVRWLKSLRIRVPRDIGVGFTGFVPDGFSGQMENSARLGAASVELVAAKIYRNEYGFPESPQLTLIEGKWVDGRTLKRVGSPVPPPVVWAVPDPVERRRKPRSS